MTHDDSQFCKPDQFIPETWIRSTLNTNSILAYGLQEGRIILFCSLP